MTHWRRPTDRELRNYRLFWFGLTWTLLVAAGALFVWGLR